MILILTDDNGNGYSFPSTFYIKSGSFSASTDVKKYAYGTGGKQVGDGFYNYRLVTIEGFLIEGRDSDFEIARAALFFACRKGGQLRIQGDSVSRFITVRKPDFDYQWEFFQRSMRISITFIAENPFWVDDTETSDANVMTGDGSFAVDGSGSVEVMLPVFEISATSVPVPSVRLTNISDGGLSLQYNNPTFYAGDLLVIDSLAGTIKLNSNPAQEYLQDGSAFLRLQPVSNTFNYEGAACTITVKFRKYYI